MFGLRYGAGDFDNPAEDPSLIYGAGHVVGNNGIGNFAGHRQTGEPTDADRAQNYGPEPTST